MSICYNDKTYCGSKGCLNKCGRQLTALDWQKAATEKLPVCTGYFCKDNGEVKKSLVQNNDGRNCS